MTKFLSLILLFLLCTPTTFGDLSEESLKHLAQKLGSELFRITKSASGHSEVEQRFRKMGATVEKLDPLNVFKGIVNNITLLMNKKVEAVKRLVENAEELTREFKWEPKPNVSYYNAKETEVSNTSGFLNMEFVKDIRFHNDPVNLTSSTVHVPTNIFNRAPVVLNGVSWSKGLDKFFRTNLEEDPGLKSQYFGSADGFLRLYPGIKWPVDPDRPDMYDCRLTNWYIRAASSPKDMVIMVDISGSMTGIREDIARATVKEIMNTLHEDDFFNIIKFKETPEFLDPCVKALTQASEATKRRFSELLKNFETENIANYTDAFGMAFQILKSSKTTAAAAHCNKAIMIISDSAPESFEEIFREMNPDKHIRIFTYVIGREVTEYVELAQMACTNRGYVTHVSTMADVRTNVEGYSRVLGRPMVLSKNHTNIWTNSYWHARQCISVFARPVGMRERNSAEKLAFWTTHVSHLSNSTGMVMTVAQPVFNRSVSAIKKGSLIGVVGIDVPIQDIRNSMEPYKWGVGSYTFGANHNGHVLFHPYWRQMAKHTLLPRNSYNEVDLAEVEFPVQLDAETVAGRPYSMKLRHDMIDQKLGQTTMEVFRQLDERKRVYQREYQYFYGGIADTPLSVGIAIPSRSGRSNSSLLRVKGLKKLNEKDLNEFDKAGIQWEIHPDWAYCNNTARGNLTALLKQSINYDPEKLDLGHVICNADLVESLMFDLHAIDSAVNVWTTPGSTVYSQYNIETAFVASRAGLTRWTDFAFAEENDIGIIRIRSADDDQEETEAEDEDEEKPPETEASPEITQNETASDSRDFFKIHSRAVDESFYERTVMSDNEMTITISLSQKAAVHITEDESSFMASVPVHIGDGTEQSAPAAITGVIMKTRRFRRMLEDVSRETCGRNVADCLSCHNPAISCFLVDESGYIVLSTRPHDDRGKFFGMVHGEVMETLIDQGVFTEYELKDFQGSCQEVRNVSTKSCASFLRPWLSGMATLATQIMLFAWTMVKDVLTAELDPSSYNYEGTTENETIHEISPPAPFLCDTDIRLFHSDWTQLKAGFDIFCRSNCTKRVGIYKVSTTNLLLIAMDKFRTCPCEDKPISIKPKQSQYGENETCSKFTAIPYRRGPSDCFPFHKDEDSSDCGTGSSLVASSSLLLVLLIMLIVYSSE